MTNYTRGRALTIEIPGLPPRELSPNARVHWRVKAKYTSDYRLWVGYHVLEAWGFQLVPSLWKDMEHARIDVTFVVPDRRRRDKMNLASAFKAGLDGIVDAGIIRDDSHDCVDDQYYVRYEKGVSKTLVEIQCE